MLKNMSGFGFNLLVLLFVGFTVAFTVSSLVLLSDFFRHHLWLAGEVFVTGSLAWAYALEIACRPKWPVYK